MAISIFGSRNKQNSEVAKQTATPNQTPAPGSNKKALERKPNNSLNIPQGTPQEQLENHLITRMKILGDTPDFFPDIIESHRIFYKTVTAPSADIFSIMDRNFSGPEGIVFDKMISSRMSQDMIETIIQGTIATSQNMMHLKLVAEYQSMRAGLELDREADYPLHLATIGREMTLTNLGGRFVQNEESGGEDVIIRDNIYGAGLNVVLAGLLLLPDRGMSKFGSYVIGRWEKLLYSQSLTADDRDQLAEELVQNLIVLTGVAVSKEDVKNIKKRPELNFVFHHVATVLPYINEAELQTRSEFEKQMKMAEVTAQTDAAILNGQNILIQEIQSRLASREGIKSATDNAIQAIFNKGVPAEEATRIILDSYKYLIIIESRLQFEKLQGNEENLDLISMIKAQLARVVAERAPVSTLTFAFERIRTAKADSTKMGYALAALVKQTWDAALTTHSMIFDNKNYPPTKEGRQKIDIELKQRHREDILDIPEQADHYIISPETRRKDIEEKQKEAHPIQISGPKKVIPNNIFRNTSTAQVDPNSTVLGVRQEFTESKVNEEYTDDIDEKVATHLKKMIGTNSFANRQ